MAKVINVRLNRRFYSLGSIKKSMQDYREVADFRLKTDKNNFFLSLFNFEETLADKLADEFANYVLFIEAARSW